MLSRTDGSGTRNFTWDSENRLTQVSLPGGLTVNYKYDALGRRIQRTTSNGADERYVHDGHDVLLDLNSSLAITTSYLNGPGMDDHLRQTNTTTGVSYFLTDHLGTTTALTDGSGTVVETLNYDSFGNNAGSARTRYTYTGRERDPDTGLLHYRARFYDPQLGRFISEDPIGLKGGMNLFAYVENSPVRKTDPSGRCPQDPKPLPHPTPLPDPCNSPESWNTRLQDWRQLGKSIGWNFADDGTPIDRQDRSFQQIKADLEWAGFWEFLNLNFIDHPGGSDFEGRINGRWYHVTIYPTRIRQSRTNPRRVPNFDLPLSKIEIHCETNFARPQTHLWSDKP